MDKANAKVVKALGPGLEMDEDAVVFLAIGCGFLDKVDVIDFATGIAFGKTSLAEDSANAAVLDVRENPRNAEGGLMGLEFDLFLDGGVLGRSCRRLLSGHDSVRDCADDTSVRCGFNFFGKSKKKYEMLNNE